MCISVKFFTIKYILFVSLYLVLTACSKGRLEPVEPIGKGYIKGNFADEFLAYSEPLYTPFDQVDTISNVYWSDSHRISLIRNDSKKPSQGIEIRIFNFQLDSVKLPIEFSSAQSHSGFII